MTTEQYVTLGKRTAITSFLFGTVIFVLYFLTSAFDILFVGYAFIIIVGLINIGVLIVLLNKADKVRENKTKLYKTCGLMLLNIPVMLIYCWIAIILLDTVRIIFINSTQTELTDIKIIGCEPKYIDKLKPGQWKVVWVGITGDCSINIAYLSNGQRKEENVTGYLTNSMGQKMKYNIGGKNEQQF